MLLFPPKCTLCRTILESNETDLCHDCRANAPEFPKAKIKLSFIAQWTAVWYYKDNVRSSLLRYKFHNARSYSEVYGRFLAMKLQTQDMDRFDVLTWVTTGRLRVWKRGYDHMALIARAVARELNVTPVKTLKKTRHTPPQSGLSDASQRRANVLGAYHVIDPALVSGKHVLLLDDIITTGATVSECARVLLTAGAKSVACAAVAVASHDTKK